MDITMTQLGMWLALAVWPALAIPTIVFLARRKSTHVALTVFWGVLMLLIPPVGLVFIMVLLLLPNQRGYAETTT